MNPKQTGCLILACGNTLRSDDGVGPWLAAWAEDRFRDEPRIRIIARQQWTPDLAEDVARADAVVFVDCAIDSSAGEVRVRPVASEAPGSGLATHHTGAAELLQLAQDLFESRPRHALLLTVGAGSTELAESFSSGVTDALPQACRILEDSVLRLFPTEI